MAEEFETVEIEISEDDIVYYLFDEDDQEIGFVVDQDGEEVEYYYEWVDSDAYRNLDARHAPEEAKAFDPEAAEAAGNDPAAADEDVDAEGGETYSLAELSELDGKVVEMEIDEDAIDHYLFDEKGNEVGFVIVEDGVEVECYYQDEDDDEDDDDGDLELAEKPVSPDAGADDSQDHGYLYKLAQIAGHEGGKARKKAEGKVEKVRDKAGEGVSKMRSQAEKGVDKATEMVEAGGEKLKAKSDEYDLGITREGVAEATADLNAIAKEGAATAKEFKEAYDDIMDSFGFLMPKGVRRKLP